MNQSLRKADTVQFRHIEVQSIGINAINITGDVNSGGIVRAKGWYTSGAGHAVETGVTSGSGWIISYDRTADTYMPLQLSASTVYFNAPITSTGNYFSTGSSFALSPATQSAYVRQFTTDSPVHGLWRNWETVTNNTEGGDIEWRVGASQGANPTVTAMHLDKEGNLSITGSFNGAWNGDDILSNQIIDAVASQDQVGNFVIMNSATNYETSAYGPSSFQAAGNYVVDTDFTWTNLGGKPSLFTTSDETDPNFTAWLPANNQDTQDLFDSWSAKANAFTGATTVLNLLGEDGITVATLTFTNGVLVSVTTN
jgi:hypothetical protein